MAKLLEWVESPRYHRAHLAVSNWRPRYFLWLSIGVAIASVFIGLIESGHMKVQGDKWKLHVTLLLLFGGLLPLIRWFQSWEGDKIVIGTGGIGRCHVVGKRIEVTTYSWETIVSCHLGSISINSQEFPALVAVLENGQEVHFALSDKVLLDDIRRAIVSQGKDFKH